MDTSGIEGNEILSLSQFDQVAARLYVRWLLCYGTDQASYPGHARTAESVELGIANTIMALPFLRGNIQTRKDDESRVDVHIPRTSTQTPLVLKYLDCGSDETIAPYTELRDSHFPIASLRGEVLSPVPFIPVPPTPAKALAVQANFIRGGLILCVAIHHSIADGSGMGSIISRLIHNCRLASLSDKTPVPLAKKGAVGPGTGTGTEHGYPLDVERTRFFPGEGVTKLEHPEYVIKSPQNLRTYTPTAPTSGTPTCLRTVRFSHSKLELLKDSHGFQQESLTTNDLLTALLFGAVCTARSLRLGRSAVGPQTGTESSRIIIAVNGRSRLQPSVHPSYIGNVVVSATFSVPYPLAIKDDVLDVSFVQDLAKRTHAAVAQIGPHHMASALSLIESLDNVLSLQTAAGQNGPGKDFGVTSWVHLPLYGEQLWVGGNCDSVRVPGAEIDGLAIILPRVHATADLEVMLGLRVDDMVAVEKFLQPWIDRFI